MPRAVLRLVDRFDCREAGSTFLSSHGVQYGASMVERLRWRADRWRLTHPVMRLNAHIQHAIDRTLWMFTKGQS